MLDTVIVFVSMALGYFLRVMIQRHEDERVEDVTRRLVEAEDRIIENDRENAYRKGYDAGITKGREEVRRPARIIEIDRKVSDISEGGFKLGRVNGEWR